MRGDLPPQFNERLRVTWRDAIVASLHSYCRRHRTAVIVRQAFLAEELQRIREATGSHGRTPGQTLSRHLQELRDDGAIEFLSAGRYLMLDADLKAEAEEFDEEVLETALKANRLKFGDVPTSDSTGTARRRRGQRAVRRLTVELYAGRCAVCDVSDRPLLVASHIARWADAPEHRGDLRNLLCLCRPHDALFELGYWGMSDEFSIIIRPDVASRHLCEVLARHTRFRRPGIYCRGV